ncbi:MAG: hypothetical protein ACRC68_14060 [Clostridium sp.]
MMVTVGQNELIKRIHSLVNAISIETEGNLFKLFESYNIADDDSKVYIDNEEYKSLINKINSLLKSRDEVVRYNLATTIQEYLERFELDVRVCTSCLSLMVEGYVIDGGADYYCTDKCLEFDMTLEEFNEAYGDGETETYFTEWY